MTKKLFEEGKAQVQEGGGGYAEYDDGKYRAQVVSATMGRSQASGRWQHVMGFKFLEGDYKGQTCYQYQGLENAMGFTVLAAQFAKLGIEIDSPDDLESADKKVTKEKAVVEIRLRTKGEFQNILVLKPVDAEDETEDADEDESEDEKIVEAEAEVEETKDEDDDAETDADEDDEDEEDEDEADDDEDDDEEDEEEKKPAPKKAVKKKEVEVEEDEDSEDDEKDEDDEDEEKEEKVTLDVGIKVKVKYEDETVVGKIVKVDEEKSRIKVKMKDGTKVWVSVPDDVVDVIG